MSYAYLVLLAAVSFSENPDAIPTNPVVETPEIETTMEVPYRSPGLAVGLSAAVPLALMAGGAGLYQLGGKPMQNLGGVLAVTGLLLGPSAGHMYTGDWDKVGLFALGRVGTILVVSALGYANGKGAGGADEWDGLEGLVTGFFVSMACVLAIDVWEMALTWDSAEKFNQRQAGVQLNLTPMVLPPAVRDATTTPAYGLGLGGRF